MNGFSSAPGGAPIRDEQVVYVRTNGSDATGVVGRADKPFATFDYAYAAGNGASQNYIVDLGAGIGATLTDPNGINSYLKGFRGPHGIPASVTINVTPAAVTDGNGAAGNNVTLELHNVSANIIAMGGGCTDTFGSSYTAGQGGAVVLTGSGYSATVDVTGGGDSGTSVGSITGGNGGTISISGPATLGATPVVAGGAGASGGSAASDGTATLDLVDIRLIDINSSAISCGRCSLASGGTFTDKGGNATY